MKTERMTFLMTAADKAAITERAANLHIPASELVRRAVDSYDPDAPEAELKELAEALRDVVEATDAKLDDALARLDAFEAYFAAREDLTAEIRAEVEAGDLHWPFGDDTPQPTRRQAAGRTL